MVKYSLRIQESNMDETPLQYANIAEDNMVALVPHQHALSLRDITISIILAKQWFDKSYCDVLRFECANSLYII